MELIVTSRQNKTAKDLRKEGLIPGIVYGKHLKEPIMVASKRNDMKKNIRKLDTLLRLPLPVTTLISSF
jgi:ribosomal protein L25 (general stress protein Ctc)